MAHEMISKEEHDFIHKVIGPHLQKQRNVTLETYFKKPYAINYCTISNGDPHSFMDNIVLVPGFGSGWTGTMRLGYELAKLGWQVTAISLYGYGNSSNPAHIPKCTSDFAAERGALREWAWETFPGQKIHWIGHSMGAAIITTLAGDNPELAASLTLLNPAGFEKRNPLELALKFGLNGIMHSLAFRGDPIWAELQKFLPKEKSPFSFDRLRQRLNEGLRICNGNTIESFRKLPKGMPIKYITGEKDFVFPYCKSAIIQDWYENKGRRVLIDWTPGTYHNTTMFKSKEAAKMIHDFICSIDN